MRASLGKEVCIINKLLKQLEAYVKCSVDHFSVDEAQPLPPAIPFRPVVRSVGSMAQQSTCLKIYSALLSSPGRLQLPAQRRSCHPPPPSPSPCPSWPPCTAPSPVVRPATHGMRRTDGRTDGRTDADADADAIHRFYLRHPSAAMAVLEISPRFERERHFYPENATGGSGSCNSRNLLF